MMLSDESIWSMRWSEQTSNPSSDDSAAPTIKNHSVTHFNGYLYCFGGYDGRRNHLTLLLYSIAEQRWIRPHRVVSDQTHLGDNYIVVAGSPPPGRNGHSATLAIDPDDSDNGRIVIIGGWLGTGPLAASDMHVLDLSNGGKHLRWWQPEVKGTPPGPCNMHSADYVPSKREVYVFRGGNGREYLNDLHALCTQTLVWRKVKTTGAAPQQRANHSSAILESTGELFIFGGWNGTERLNDIHILDTETSTWTCPQAGGILPHPRAGMTLTALRGQLFLFGGSGTSSRCFQDLQILDRSEMAWLDVTQYESNGNGNRHRHHDDNHHHHHHRHHMDRNDYDPQWSFGGYYDSQPQASNASSAVQSQSQQGGDRAGDSDVPYTNSGDAWRSRDMSVAARPPLNTMAASPNPNDQDTVPSVTVHGRGPGRRAGHTATAVGRKIYIFGGSCGSDYLNDFYVLDTDPPQHATVSEPTSLQLIERRLKHFFNDEEFSDVVFLVQGHRVYGHKMILSVVSDCFRAMFTAGFREQESMEIEIKDCSYVAFLALIEYIYTGKVPRVEQPQQQQQQQQSPSHGSVSGMAHSNNDGNNNNNGNTTTTTNNNTMNTNDSIAAMSISQQHDNDTITTQTTTTLNANNNNNNNNQLHQRKRKSKINNQQTATTNNTHIHQQQINIQSLYHQVQNVIFFVKIISNQHMMKMVIQ
mmetsp:Transcript_2559/g.6944  ORF Transcript_2559/g.6944 Transcript_2559/m.6944 type:complete len:697 (-) Transcript_2559:392-2482(-)